MAAVSLLALLNVFGQWPSTATVAVSAATLEIRSPPAVRGGLLFQARYTVRASRALKAATLVLGRGWLDGLTVNTIEPSPLNEASRDGRLSLELGHIPAGEKHVLYIQYQVNPTTVGSHAQTVALYDGDERLLVHERKLRVYP
ncbi:MAG TPA: hypothetical protein VK287_08530 [Gaiellaceae bacterium]|nr:hypothetical protein [Gaiellaceae bacterium]